MTLSLHSTCHYNTWTSYLKTPGYHTAFKMSWIKNIFFVFFSGPRPPLPLTNEWFGGTQPFLSGSSGYLYKEIFMNLEELSLWYGKSSQKVLGADPIHTFSSPHLCVYEQTTGQWEPWWMQANHRYCWLSKLLVRKEGRKQQVSSGRVNRAAEVHILPFCSHSMWQQHEMPQFLHKSGKETAFVSRLNLDSHPFTSQVPSPGLPVVWGQMSNRNRKQWLQCPFSGVFPMAQDLGFDKKRISEYKEIPKFSLICFGIFLPTSNSCVITWAFARTTCCLTPTLNEKASTC